MGLKYDNLKQLTKRGVNTHEYLHIENDLERNIQRYIEINKDCTFRADHNYMKYQLPMLIGSESTTEQEIREYVEKCNKWGCTVVASNGKKHDPIQIANIVVLIDDGDIRIETSRLKVPLRTMYKYPKDIFGLKGSIHDKVNKFEKFGNIENRLSSGELERILNRIFEIKKKRETNFELTYYPKKVGVLKEDIIFWQIQ